MRAARTTTIRKWLEVGERIMRWKKLRSSSRIARQLGMLLWHLTMSGWHATLFLFLLCQRSFHWLSCPIVEAEKLRHGDLPIGDHPDLQSMLQQLHTWPWATTKLHRSCSPTWIQTMRLESKCRLGCIQALAVAHWMVNAFLERSIMKGGATYSACHTHRFIHFCIPTWEHLRGQRFRDLWTQEIHDFQAMENDLAWKLASRRPLQVSSEDCKGFHQSCLPSANSAWGRCQHQCFDFDHSNLWNLKLFKPYI